MPHVLSPVRHWLLSHRQRLHWLLYIPQPPLSAEFGLAKCICGTAARQNSRGTNIGFATAMKRFAGPALQCRHGARASRGASSLTWASLRCCAPVLSGDSACAWDAARTARRWNSSLPKRPRTAIFFPGEPAFFALPRLRGEWPFCFVL